MQYYIHGNTYPLRDDIKKLSCKWITTKKCWLSSDISKEDWLYEQLDILAKTPGVFMTPMKTDKECEKIQNILGK